LNAFFKSRIIELLFGTGIPMVGFFCAVRNMEGLSLLYIAYPLLLITGWHVLAVNDICFDRKKFSFSLKYFLPIIVVPIILGIFCLQKPVFALVLFLIIVNWNIYSVYGKYHWLTGLFHNFSGGLLHFLAGIAAAGCSDMFQFAPQALFFGFAMLSGAVHHDASHSAEDLDHNYRTGAVVFGEFNWWRLGILPMFVGMIFLLHTNDMPFMLSFCISTSIYFVLYLAMSTFKPAGYMLYFRLFCRIAFAIGAIGYVVLKITRLG